MDVLHSFQRRLWIAPLALALAGLTGPLALAQQGGPLAPALISKTSSLDAGEKTQLQKYIEANSANIDGADNEKFRRDRDALLAPLSDEKVSVPFRLEYSRSLLELVKKVSKSQDKIRAINGLVFAGELATKDSLQLAIESLGSSSPDIRYAAAAAIRQSFHITRTKSPAIDLESIRQAISKLGERIPQETDAIVLDAVVQAILEAAAVDDARAMAVETVGGAIANRLKAGKAVAFDAAGMGPYVRAVSSIRETLAAAQGAGKTVPASAVKAAADLAGCAITHTVKVVEAGGLPLVEGSGKASPTDPRELYAQFTLESETILQLSAQLLGKGSAVTPKDLGRTLRTGSKNADAKFGVDAREHVGPGGELYKSPFDFQAGRFL